MKVIDPLRRRLLIRLAAAVGAAPLALLRPGPARAADLPLLDPSSPAAKKYRYVPEASQAHGANGGHTCSICAMYQGAHGSKRGPCMLFTGHDVRAAGWCTSWDAHM